MTVEVLGGLAGVVLGILALLHLVPTILLAIAAIAFGSTLILASAATARLRALVIPGHRLHRMAWRVAWESILAAATGQAFLGIAAIVLGIVALANYLSPISLTLTLVALLCLGASVLLSGTAVTGKVLSVLRR
jgi:hypothetical protein